MLPAATLLFCSMIPPPPTSTLFPYTTLFRSPPTLPTPTIPTLSDVQSSRPRRSANRESTDNTYSERRGLDRKSTRLNSSHVRISYAVFCLKKKRLKRHLQPVCNMRYLLILGN